MLDHTAAARLTEGFWRQVRADLAAGCPETLEWIASNDFAWWAAWSFGDLISAEDARRRLLSRIGQLSHHRTSRAA